MLGIWTMPAVVSWSGLLVSPLFEPDPQIPMARALLGEARDGGAALQQIQALAPDLAFVAVRMPDLDGPKVHNALVEETLPAALFVAAE